MKWAGHVARMGR